MKGGQKAHEDNTCSSNNDNFESLRCILIPRILQWVHKVRKCKGSKKIMCKIMGKNFRRVVTESWTKRNKTERVKIYQNPYKFKCPVLLNLLTLMVDLEMLEYYIMNSVMIEYNLECLATMWLLFIQFKK